MIFKHLIFGILLASSAHAATPYDTIQKLEAASAMGRLSLEAAIIGSNADDARKACTDAESSLDAAIGPAMRVARGHDLRDAIKAYYVSATSYFRGVVENAAINRQRLLSDMEAKEKALDLELSLAGVK